MQRRLIAVTGRIGIRTQGMYAALTTAKIKQQPRCFGLTVIRFGLRISAASFGSFAVYTGATR